MDEPPVILQESSPARLRQRPWRRWLRRAFTGLIVLVVAWLFGSFLVAHQLTRPPLKPFAEPVPQVSWGKFAPVRLSTTDGEELGAWFVEGRADLPVVILLHGNGRCRGACLSQAKAFVDVGCSVLLVTLRAHGDSTGDFNDFGFSARHDVLAAVGWIEQRHPGRPVVLFGQSLGSAAALFAARELGRRVHGYILECPYQDLRTALWNRSTHYLPPVADRLFYYGQTTVALLFVDDLDQISPVRAAVHVPTSVPVLILAGGADRRARPEEAQAIATQLPGGAEVVLFPKGNHLQLQTADSAGYEAALVKFIAACRRDTR